MPSTRSLTPTDPVSSLPRGATVRRDAGLYGYERALRRHGIDPIAGVDEAGRGACAGPLVAGACILPPGKAGIVPGLADSKLLTEKARERCYAQVVRRALAWSVVVVSHEECDRLGMHVANVEALRRAVALLDLPPAYVLTDGFPVDGLGVPGLAVWKGDRVAACIAAGVGAGQGDPRPDHDRAGRGVAGLRLQDPQGLHHRGAQRGADRARPVAGAPDALRQRTPRGGSRAAARRVAADVQNEHVVGARAGPVGGLGSVVEQLEEAR